MLYSAPALSELVRGADYEELRHPSPLSGMIGQHWAVKSTPDGGRRKTDRPVRYQGANWFMKDIGRPI